MSSSIQYPLSERPSATFVGMARSFTDRMLTLALASAPTMRAISDDAMRQFKRRSGSLRPETLVTIERLWQETCNDGCLDLIIRRDKKTISIRDTRLMTSKITHNYGEIDEPALSIMVSTVVIGITKIETDSATVAALNLHSLARRYQRGFGNPGDLAILRDIRAVAVAAPDLIADNTFAIPTPSGGCWRGFVGNMLCERDTSRQVVAVRTFV